MLISFVSGCATTNSSNACPPLITYTPGQLAQAEREIAEFGPEVTALVMLVADYSKTRAAIRRCRGEP